MDLRARRPLLAGVLVAVLAAAAFVTYLVVRGSSPPPGIASDRLVTIRTPGAALSAEVIVPPGRRTLPLVVMPAAWGGKATMYHAIAVLLARHGYAVVAYAQRGFGGSTGEVDFAGAGTQRDARAVIDWALRHVRADPARIGMFGVSYGAGVSLLTAARDPRVRAVVALSTWTDFAQTFDQDGTPHTAALLALLGEGGAAAHLDATVQRLATAVRTAPASLGPLVRQMSPERSPAADIAGLNRNRPAIMIGNGFEDSIIEPAQLVPFFAALTTPKRLQLARGDHGGPERTGLTGSANPVIDDGVRWLDHYLRGRDNGIARQGPIVLHDVATGRTSRFTTWPVAGAREQVPLGPPGRTMSPGDAAARSWTAAIRAGTDSGADSAALELVPGPAYRPPLVAMSRLDTRAAFVWQGPPLRRPYAVRGSPSVRFGLAASTPTVTLYAYLYDVAPNGLGVLMDTQPFTATGLRPRTPAETAIGMQPIAWTLAAGDHFALVIDTVDPRFTSLTAPGTTVTVSSSPGRPAQFAAPTGS